MAPAAEHLGILLRCRAWSGLRGHDSASPTHSWAWPAAERPAAPRRGHLLAAGWRLRVWKVGSVGRCTREAR